LGALMIPKVEDGIVDSNPPLPRKRRMKIALLKVDHTGHKIGELFIKLAVHNAITVGCEELYLTHFVGPNDTLVDLIREYGFEPSAKNARGEELFTRNLR